MTTLVTVIDGLAFGLVYFCLAAGLAIIFGAAQVLNLAHGSFFLLGGCVAWVLADGSWPVLVGALTVAVIVGAFAGAALSAVVAPLARRGHLDQAVLTLGVSLLWAEAYALVTGGNPLPAAVPAALQGSVSLAGHAYPVYRLVFIAVAALLAVGIWAVIERSRVGAVVRAVVADRDMAAALGYRPGVIMACLFVAGGTVAVVAGVLALSVHVHTGLAGQPTLGQGAYLGVGAYVAAHLARDAAPGVIQLASAAVAGGLVAAATGLAVVRTRGVATVMLTLAIAEIAYTSATRWKAVTGGSDGLTVPATAAGWTDARARRARLRVAAVRHCPGVCWRAARGPVTLRPRPARCRRERVPDGCAELPRGASAVDRPPRLGRSGRALWCDVGRRPPLRVTL